MNVRLLFLIGATCFGNFFVQAQSPYDGDNTRYRTISFEELPAALAKSPDAVIIDVRTPGEYSDTSHWASLNIGHLKGAKNIDHREVAARLNELPDRDKPVYLYCSHSQRSRRVGNMLADSGYTNVINVNGGMSRYWTEQDRLHVMDPLVERWTTYGILNPRGLCGLIAKRPVFLLDVRPDSVLRPGPAYERMRAFGSLKGSTRIPLELLEQRSASIPRDKAVVCFGEYTADGAKAAAVLQGLGFKDVHILFNGLEGMLDATPENCPCKKDIAKSDVTYGAIAVKDLDTLAITAGKLFVLDIRTDDEFNGTAKDGWMNVGRFRGARHVAAKDLRGGMAATGLRKEDRIVLVARGPEDELFDAAQRLTEMGYKHISVLTSGIWDIRWQAHNLPGHAPWDAWVTKYPTATP